MTRGLLHPKTCAEPVTSPHGAGACAAAYDAFCAKIKPGEGRFADCLTAQQHEEEKGNVDGE